MSEICKCGHTREMHPFVVVGHQALCYGLNSHPHACACPGFKAAASPATGAIDLLRKHQAGQINAARREETEKLIDSLPDPGNVLAAPVAPINCAECDFPFDGKHGDACPKAAPSEAAWLDNVTEPGCYEIWYPGGIHTVQAWKDQPVLQLGMDAVRRGNGKVKRITLSKPPAPPLPTSKSVELKAKVYQNHAGAPWTVELIEASSGIVFLRHTKSSKQEAIDLVRRVHGIDPTVGVEVGE